MADHERLRASSDVSSSSRASLSGGSSRRAPRDPKFRPNLIRCDVHPPARSAGVWDAHLVFKVDCTSRLRDYVTTCRVELIAGHTAHFSVQRRFADFVWLRRRLGERYPGAILPAPPPPRRRRDPNPTPSISRANSRGESSRGSRRSSSACATTRSCTTPRRSSASSPKETERRFAPRAPEHRRLASGEVRRENRRLAALARDRRRSRRRLRRLLPSSSFPRPRPRPPPPGSVGVLRERSRAC